MGDYFKIMRIAKSTMNIMIKDLINSFSDKIRKKLLWNYFLAQYIIFFSYSSPLGIQQDELIKMLVIDDYSDFELLTNKYNITIDVEGRVNCKESLRNLKNL